MTRKQSTILKGLAILLIVVYHFQAALTENAILPRGQGLIFWFDRISNLPWYQPKNLISLLLLPGFLGVNIFFVLSGYGLTQKYNHVGGNLKDIYKGMWHQIKKIYPTYLIFHPIVHLGAGLVWLFLWHKSLSFFQWLSFYPWQNYLKSLLIFPRWFNNTNMFIFVGTWWFIGVIVQLYLTFPILYKLKQRFGDSLFLALVLTVTFSWRFLVFKLGFAGPVGVNGSDTFWWVNFPARLAEFGLGMILAKAHFQTFKANWLPGAVLTLVGLAGVVVPWLWFANDFLLALGGVWLGYYLINRLNPWCESRFLWLGRYSYFIYLLHEPFLGQIIRGY